MGERVSIIGAGAAGLSINGIANMAGYKTVLYNRSPERIKEITNKGFYSLIMPDGREEKITDFRVTSNLMEAVKEADIVILAVNTNAQFDIAANIVEYVNESQTILLVPGHTGGAICIKNAFIKCGLSKLPVIAEVQALPFVCRVKDGSHVEIYQFKRNVYFACIPSEKTRSTYHKMSRIFDNLVEVPSTLWTGLHNMTIVFQPVICLLNAGRTRDDVRYKFYVEGVNEYVGNVMNQLDNERLEVAENLGVTGVITAGEWLRKSYDSQGNTLCELVKNTKGYRTIEAPGTLHHRFILEHVCTGLVPLEALAHANNINVPITTSLIELSSCVLGIDLREKGRNAEKLGILNLSGSKLKDMFLA